MIIKRLSASFGRLSNQTLELRGGLNIIEAPNESGKSTWCAFIRAMLYGLRTSDRDKSGYLSDKTRYRPWSGVPMEGSMDIQSGSSSLTLERKSDGKLPMRDFSAVYTGTGTPYVGLHPDTAGDTLIGASEAVFERSAFISQSGIRVVQTPELEKRISSLVTTGDEDSSYTETDERLRLWLRKRQYNKSGTIPALEEKIFGIKKKLTHIEAALDEAASMRLEAERLKKRQTELHDEITTCDKFDALQGLRRALENQESAKSAYDDIYGALTRNGPAPTDGDLSAIRGDLQALASFKTMLVLEQKHLEDARDNYANLCTKKNDAFDGSDAPLAVETAVSLERTIKKYACRNASAVLLILTAVMTALISVLAYTIVPQIPAVRPIAAALAVLCAAILLLRCIQFRSFRKNLAAHLSRYNVPSVSELRNAYEGHLIVSSDLTEAESEIKSSEKSVSSASVMVDTVLESLRGRMKSLSADTDLDNLEAVLSQTEALLTKLTEAKAEIQAAEKYMKTLRASGPFGDAENLRDITAPARTRPEISADLSVVTARLEELTNRYNMALGEIRAIGDPVILGSEKIYAEAALLTQKAQYESISLAIETLKDANNELQTRFSPLLSETAGQIIHSLTGGRYDKLAFDKAFNVSAKTSDETVSRNILTLSAGTSDQIYLALRLAVAKLILPSEDPCPLILDDALANFDDERAYLALDYFKELSRERQILLFTCHKREAGYFTDSADVNIMKL